MKEMKKKLLKLLCIALVAIVTFVGTKTLKSNAYDRSNLLIQNVEALTSPEDEPYPEERKKCIEEGGSWNMASVCKNSGFESCTCKISGKITAFGVTLEGSYEKGKTYTIPWARYECQESKGNCCKKQGLYSGEEKLA